MPRHDDTVEHRRLRLRARWQSALRYSALPPKVRGVGHALVMFGDQDGGRIRPAVQTVADGAGVSRSAAVTALKVLAEAGWIVRAGGGGRGVTTRYSLRIPAAADKALEDYLNRSAQTNRFPRESGQVGGQTEQERPDRTPKPSNPEQPGAFELQSLKEPLTRGEGEEQWGPPPWVAEGLTWQEWGTREREQKAAARA
jgi:hypothetical protein